MNIPRVLTFTVLLGCLPVFGACSSGQSGNASTPSSSGSLLTGVIDHALDRAEVELTTKNLTLDDDDKQLPKAEITPKGDLLIAGKAVALTPAQRKQVLAYRQQVIAIGEQGIALGRQGAAFGLHAASTAIADAFAGKSDEGIKQKVEAQTPGIKQAATKLCHQLPAMMAEQQQLAAAVPAFKPYATMTQKDIENCHVDWSNHDDH